MATAMVEITVGASLLMDLVVITEWGDADTRN